MWLAEIAPNWLRHERLTPTMMHVVSASPHSSCRCPSSLQFISSTTDSSRCPSRKGRIYSQRHRLVSLHLIVTPRPCSSVAAWGKKHASTCPSCTSTLPSAIAAHRSFKQAPSRWVGEKSLSQTSEPSPTPSTRSRIRTAGVNAIDWTGLGAGRRGHSSLMSCTILIPIHGRAPLH